MYQRHSTHGDILEALKLRTIQKDRATVGTHFLRLVSTFVNSRCINVPVPVLPSRFCPFRFFAGEKTKEESSSASTTSSVVPADIKQPPPLIFGFGKHTCPGRELAKLDILLFLRTFLSKFEYDVVEGQVGRRKHICKRGN